MGNFPLQQVDIPEMELKEFVIDKFKLDKPCIRSLISGRPIPTGVLFTRLLRKDNTIVMSDTPSEMKDHLSVVNNASGSVLINGLGIGMVLKNILLKTSVTDITVIEISQELIDAISPYYNDDRVTFVCSNAFDYIPPKGKKYNVVWHDIWDYICSDNIPEMNILRKKYSRKSKWQGFWCERECLLASRLDG
jgi:hypothetical protein